jgi:acetoin utilization deacetylase AcuC-like enzyme
LDELATVHDRAYVEQVKADSVQGKRYGASTLLPPGGWTAVTLAAGAALDAADRVLSGACSSDAVVLCAGRRACHAAPLMR